MTGQKRIVWPLYIKMIWTAELSGALISGRCSSRGQRGFSDGMSGHDAWSGLLISTQSMQTVPNPGSAAGSEPMESAAHKSLIGNLQTVHTQIHKWKG